MSAIRPASAASPSMTGMIGWSAPASVKPSSVMPSRNWPGIRRTACRAAHSPASIIESTRSEVAAITGASVFENR